MGKPAMNKPRPQEPGIIRRRTLELNGPTALRAKFVDRDDVAVRRVEQPLPGFNRFLHEAVGTEFHWGGREEWTVDDWTEFTDRPELETWVLYVRGTPAGYFETEHFDDGSARIHNFGLMRPFFGQGLGAGLVNFVVLALLFCCADQLRLSELNGD